jgi:hypothetical protein
MSITALPKPQKNLYGVYHFLYDRCCLLTISPIAIEQLHPGINLDEAFPLILGTALSFAIYYNVLGCNEVYMPKAFFYGFTQMERLYLDKCGVYALREILGLVRDHGTALRYLNANIRRFDFTDRNSHEVVWLQEVITMAVQLEIEFHITVAVSYAEFVDMIPVPKFKEGCDIISSAIDSIYPLFPLPGFKIARESRERGAKEVFMVHVDSRNQGNPTHHTMYFYNNEISRPAEGAYFSAFENLTFVMQKNFLTGLTADDRKQNPQYLSDRGDYLRNEFVIFADISGNYNPAGLDVVDIDPLWVDEVSAFLGLKVYVDGFGSTDVRKDALARMWHVTKTLYEISAALNSHIMPCMLFKFLFE